MAHGGHQKHRVAGKPISNSSNGRNSVGLKRPLDRKIKKKKTTKAPSIKNQIRAIERLLSKDLPAEVQDAKKKHLEDLKKQAAEQKRSELERKMSLRYRRVKFFERRKIERGIIRLEKLLEAIEATDAAKTEQKSSLAEELVQLKEDLEYVRFFPRTEKYVSLFMGNENEEVIAKRNKLREQIKANIAAAAASGVDLEETDIDQGGAMAVNDDFFLADSASDDGEMEDQFTITTSKRGAVKKQTSNSTAKSSGNHTPGHTNLTFKSPQHSRGLKMQKQRPDVIFVTKDDQRNYSTSRVPRQDDRRHSFTGAQNKKWSWPDSQINHSKGGDSKLKESMGSQKSKRAKIVPPLSSLSSSYSKSLQPRHPPALSSTIDINEASTVPEHGSLNMDAKKKRRRKHRPKKKKA